MGNLRYDKMRDQNEKEIIRALEKCGCSVFTLDVPCDLLVGRGATTLLLEVKMPAGRLTKKQREFAASWKGQYRIVTTAEEAIDYVTRLTVKNAL